MTGPRSTAIRPEAAALDALTRANVQNLLLNVLATEGKTVMLITHSVEEAIYHDGDGPPRWVSFTVAYGRYSILRESLVHGPRRKPGTMNAAPRSVKNRKSLVSLLRTADYAGSVGTVFGAGGCSTAPSSGNFSPCTATGVPIQSGFAR
jgi:hypothetical protein